MIKKKIIIVDYGVGNILSIKNAVSINGYNALITSNNKTIENATHIILPGVGSFPAAMEKLKKKKLDDSIKKAVKNDVYLLGICLGMQLIFSESDEFKTTKGIGIIEGKIKKIKTDLKLPNIGWRNCILKNNNSKIRILKNISSKDHFYFVHSYCLNQYDKTILVEKSKYGKNEFPCIFENQNIFGCQFHPEKSRTSGLKIINNFISLE
tara:strand:+ start:67 stop:693 length:627 start_codon:yes stop_codon:yes gene_type:complete